MSRSAPNSETIILITAASEEEPPVVERRPPSRNQMSRKTVYKIVQQQQPPSPPPPAAEEDDEQRDMSLSVSMEEANVPMCKAQEFPSGSQVVRVLPQGTSIVLEQISTPPRPPSATMPPRRKSLPASMPPKSPKSQSRPPSRSKSRPISPPIINLAQEQSWYESEPEPAQALEREDTSTSDETELKIKFEIGAPSCSEEEGRPERRGPSKTPEPCLDCLEEFIRRKRAEKQRKGSEASSQVEVTMSNKRMCSRRSSKSTATPSVQSYRCSKCMACKSCGCVSVTVPIARK